MRYEKAEKDWLKNNYPKLGMKETTKQFNDIFSHSMKPTTISQYCRKSLGITSDKETTKALLSANHNINSHRNGKRNYTQTEKDWLVENYPRLGQEETVRQFNKIFNHKKDKKTLQRYCSHHLKVHVLKEVTMSLKSVPIGYKYKNCRGEWKIKTKEGWKPLSHMYEEVPKGYIAFHLDGNLDNNSPDNIVIIKNGVQTTLRNFNMLSENANITRVGITWCELYRALGSPKISDM